MQSDYRSSSLPIDLLAGVRIVCVTEAHTKNPMTEDTPTIKALPQKFPSSLENTRKTKYPIIRQHIHVKIQKIISSDLEILSLLFEIMPDTKLFRLAVKTY